jgi:hypothetical protein
LATPDVVAKAQAVLSQSELLRAVLAVGYFPPSVPPDTEKLRPYPTAPTKTTTWSLISRNYLQHLANLRSPE